MRLITTSELASRTDLELAVLFHMATQALGQTKAGEPAREAVIGSLQNIGRARSHRHRRNRVAGL